MDLGQQFDIAAQIIAAGHSELASDLGFLRMPRTHAQEKVAGPIGRQSLLRGESKRPIVSAARLCDVAVGFDHEVACC